MNKKTYIIPAVRAMRIDAGEQILGTLSQDTNNPSTPTEPIEGGAKAGFFSDGAEQGSSIWDD